MLINYMKLMGVMLIVSLTGQLSAQDLMDELKDQKPETEYTYASFKTSRVVLGQSIESPAKKTLQFLVQHNFGSLNQGPYTFFGLDQSTIRLGFEYGITDRLSAGIGRSSYHKTFDGSLKYKILRQSTGKRVMPLSLSVYGSGELNTLKPVDQTQKVQFSSRLSYVAQLLIARKFSSNLTLQLSPTYIHKNLVKTRADQNDIFAAGLGGRVKLTKRTSMNAEYFYLLPGATADNYRNCLSLGFDIETGGHVFQLRFTNAQPLFESAFIAETTSRWNKGGIYFGFTINRIFNVGKHGETDWNRK
ncbi:MAG: DUF5777 family beta-barrel protein [Omnitrophica WOR_2 bacterium]